MVEGFDVVTLQGEKRLGGVHMNLPRKEKDMFDGCFLANAKQHGQETHRSTQGYSAGRQELAQSKEASKGASGERKVMLSRGGGCTFIPLPRLSKSL